MNFYNVSQFNLNEMADDEVREEGVEMNIKAVEPLHLFNPNNNITHPF